MQRGRSRRWSWLVPIVVFAAFLAGLEAWHPLPFWLLAVYGGLSLVTFAVYAHDKSAARRGSWRVAESMLLLLGLAGGWPGAVVAQQVLRHKTIKQPFRTLFWVTVVLNVVALVAFALYTSRIP